MLFCLFVGTHWVREIVSMLVRGRAEYASDPLHSLDFYDSSSIDKLPSPRILQVTHWLTDCLHDVTLSTLCASYYDVRTCSNISFGFQSHLPYRYLPNDIKKQGKIILVSRNPKDTAVSLYCMLKRLTFMFSSFSGSFHALLHCIFYSDKCKTLRMRNSAFSKEIIFASELLSSTIKSCFIDISPFLCTASFIV